MGFKMGIGMISKLRILNFQSHRDSTLDFHEGVNVIVGASDCGKTSIIRALRWLIWNRPGGEAFRSSWGGETNVDLYLDDDVNIERTKGKENLYSISQSKEVKVFKAFKTDVPEPIEKAINMDETNIQHQLDSPFLISATPGEVSAYFNRIAHLEQIDAGLKSTQQEIRALTNKKQSDKDRIKELQTELEEYEYLDKFEMDLEALEQDEGTLITLVNSRRQLETVLTDIDSTISEIEEVSTLPQHEKQVDALLKLHEKLKTVLSDFKAMMDLTSTIHYLHSDMGEIEKKTALESNVDGVLQLYDKKKEVEWDYDVLESSITLIERTQQDIEITKKFIIKKEEIFHREMPDICPLCETKLS